MSEALDDIMTEIHDRLEGSGLSFALLLWKPGLATGADSIGFAVWPQCDPEAGAAMRIAADRLGAPPENGGGDFGQQIMALAAGRSTKEVVSALADCLATTVGVIYERAGKTQAEAEDAIDQLADGMADHVRQYWGRIDAGAEAHAGGGDATT